MNSSVPMILNPAHEPIRHPAGFWLARLTLLVVLLPVTVSAADPGQELRRAVAGFYNLYVKIRPLGVPQEKALAKFRPHLSLDLYPQLKDALQAEQRYQKANGGAVPPLEESDLFTSLFEGATAFRVLSCDAAADAGSCSVEFTYVDPRAKTAHKWQDKIYLVRQARRWVIDDVEYLGDWQFMHKGRLKTLLQHVIEEGNRK